MFLQHACRTRPVFLQHACRTRPVRLVRFGARTFLSAATLEPKGLSRTVEGSRLRRFAADRNVDRNVRAPLASPFRRFVRGGIEQPNFALRKWHFDAAGAKPFEDGLVNLRLCRSEVSYGHPGTYPNGDRRITE